jgi:hypothetical protein
MATHLDCFAYNGDYYFGMVLCRPGAELDESASWNWNCYLCLGVVSGYLGMACSEVGEGKASLEDFYEIDGELHCV